MRRRKTGRDGFQGYSATSAAAWERIFGNRDPDPQPSEESAAKTSHNSESPSPVWREVPALPAELFGLD